MIRFPIAKGVPLSLSRPSSSYSWLAVAAATILAIQLLVLMEWVFFVTKPSFLAVLGPGRRLQILGAAPVPFYLAAAAPLILLGLVSLLFRSRRRAAALTRRLGVWSAPRSWAALFLLMIDNFANTVLGWSIQGSAGPGRALAVILVVGAGWLGSRTAGAWGKYLTSHPALGRTMAAACLVFSLIALLTAGPERDNFGLSAPARMDNLIDPLPNILLLGSDGLSANIFPPTGTTGPPPPTSKS